MKKIQTLSLLSVIILLISSCGDDGEPTKQAVNEKPLSITYNTTGLIYRIPKDSFVYADGQVSEYYRFRSNGTSTAFLYEYEGSQVSAYRNADPDPFYMLNEPVGNSVIMDLLGYERNTGTPGMIKFTNEGNVLVITRWEYPSLEKEDYEMEVDGTIEKRIVITFDEKNNVSKAQIFAFSDQYLELKLIMTFTDLVYDNTPNPRLGLRKEYEFLEGKHLNHDLIELYSTNNLLSYSAQYHDEGSGQVQGTNYYNFSYERDDYGRIISSKAGTNAGEYFQDIKSILYE